MALAQPVPAAGAPPAPAPPAAGSADMEVIVIEVKGTVQTSTDDGKTWLAAKTGMHLSRGASFRTGFRSSVTCGIPPDQAFTLESLGTVRVDEAVKKGKRFKTDLVMKYGATNYSIEAGGAEHETTIRTPGSTLSVRGTVVKVTDRPGFAPTAESFTGRAVFKTARGTTTVGTKGGRYARVSATEGDAAQTALNQSVVDPATALSRTATDARLIAQQTSLGAIATFDTHANIPVIINGPPPLSDAELVKSLPGSLDFVLRWTGNANLDLALSATTVTPTAITLGQQLASKLPSGGAGLSQANLGQLGIAFNAQTQFPAESLFSAGFGLDTSPSGGHIPYDNRGGHNGGMEIAYWQGTPPQGLFGVSAYHLSGAPANYTLNAYLNGAPLYIFSSTVPIVGNHTPPLSDLRKSFSLTGTLTGSSNDNGADGEVFSPSNPFFNTAIKTAGAAASVVKAVVPTASASPGVTGTLPMPASVAPAPAPPRTVPVRAPVGRAR